MSSTTANETESREEVRVEEVEIHTEAPDTGKEKRRSRQAEPVEKPKKKKAKKPAVEESSEGEESSEASGEDADYDGSGKRKKGNAKGNTSKKTKNPTAHAEGSDTSTPTPTPKAAKKPAASWRSDETFVKALESGEATMETKFGGKGAVTVRFGHGQDMMQGYTLNLLAFIADPHMVYKEGSFQKHLAGLILDLKLTKGLDQMMGRDDQPMVFEAHITAAKFKQVSAILLSMVRGISFRGTPDDKAFADVTEKVLGFMSSPDGIIKDMGIAGTEPYERYNMVMQSETNLKKAEMASAQRELNLVLGDLKLVGKAFPDVARRVTDVETMFGKKGRLLEMAADTGITQVEMAARLDISNPDNDPEIICKFLEKSKALLTEFKEIRLKAYTFMHGVAPAPVVQTVAAPTPVAAPSISPYPSIAELALETHRGIMVKAEGSKQPFEDIRKEVDGEVWAAALGICFREFCVPHALTDAKVASLRDYGQETVPSADGTTTIKVPRTVEQAIAKLGLKEGQFEKINTVFRGMVMARVSAMVLKDVQYVRPKKNGELQMLPAHKYSAVITGIAEGAFAAARKNIKWLVLAELKGHAIVVPEGISDQVWGVDTEEFMDCLVLETRSHANFNTSSLTLLNLFPVSPADDGVAMHVMRLIAGQMPEDVPPEIRTMVVDSMLFVILSSVKYGFYSIDTFFENMGFPADRPRFIQLRKISEIKGGVVPDTPGPVSTADTDTAAGLDTLANVATLALETQEVTAATDESMAAPAETLVPEASLRIDSPVLRAGPPDESSLWSSLENPMQFICKKVMDMIPPPTKKHQGLIDAAMVQQMLSEATHGVLDKIECTPELVMDSKKILKAVFDKLAETDKMPDLFEYTEAVVKAWHNNIQFDPADTFIRAVVHKICTTKGTKRDLPPIINPGQFRAWINTQIAAKLAAPPATAGAEGGSK